ncbi:MAG: hypothetical protein KDK04_11875 [Candidatus Competibacteraceae bacterium]|jgi:hypothetical protein|nr:hypothetical protein [Candidatus Competibacteraceae bacterium]MCB1812399.1 hypothetical protein [Candidatus Competibacteraceae bacterium]
MNEDALNMSLRKFLKKVGVTSQREIENAITEALSDGRIENKNAIAATMTLSIPELGLVHEIKDTINLD